MDSIKYSSVKVPEFDKHLKKAGGHAGRNVVEITKKIKTIVCKPLMIKIFYWIVYSFFFMFFYCMDEQKQDDQLEPIYSSSVPIQNAA